MVDRSAENKVKDSGPEKPRVSIALATYNGGKFLAQLLESISQQTLAPAEIIVFDDQSNDDTLAILTNFQSRLPLRVHVNEQALGVVRNFKQAVAHCQEDYIAFCDQDDVWLPEKLAHSVAALQQVDGFWPAMVYTDLRVVDEQLNSIASSYWQHRKLQPAKESFSSLLYGNIVTGCTMLINRAMANEVNRMPDDVLMHDFWIGCVAYGIGRCAFIDEPTVLYRQHTTNVTNNDAVTWQSRWKRLNGFLTDNQQAANFLLPEIKQVQKFSSLYAEKLSHQNLNAIRKLIKLKDESPFMRKWRTFLIKFLHIGYV